MNGGVLLGERVVLELTKDLWKNEYHAYFDNFYTSPSLCKKLIKNGTGSCGTVQINRKGILQSLQKAKLKKRRDKSFS